MSVRRTRKKKLSLEIVLSSFIEKLSAAQHLKEKRDKFWMCGYKHISSNYPVESPWFQSKKQQINAQCMVKRWWWSVDEHNKSNFMFLCNFSTWFHAHEPQRFFFLALFPYLTSRAHRTNKKKLHSYPQQPWIDFSFWKIDGEKL